MHIRPFALLLAFVALAACGPQLGHLEKGEKGQVARAYNGDTLELDSGLRVFLAEIDAPRGDEAYASQARQELESLALHRPVQLAYGGAHRWAPRQRTSTATSVATTDAPEEESSTATPETRQPREAAIAHVFVQSEGGRWIWLQREMVSRGAAFVRTRRDNRARAAELLAAEAEARAAHRGLWALRDYAAMSPRKAADAAFAAAPAGCRQGRFALVEGQIAHAAVQERRALLDMEGAPFSIAVFGQGFSAWDGPALASYQGKRVRVRGQIGLFHDAAQICVDHAQEIEILPPAAG